MLPVAIRNRKRYAPYELHADCLAGIWFGWADRRGLMERGDVLNAGVFLGYLGDPDGTPWSEPGSHGTRSQRQEWFTYGYEEEKPVSCESVFRARR